MAYVPHYALIYNSLFESDKRTAPLVQLPVFGYKHTIDSMGWYRTAEFALSISQSAAERLFDEAIGGAVFMYADNPNTAFFEGYIERIVISYGGVTATRSLENMQNRVSVTYFNEGTTTTETTANFENTTSQAKYGIKQASIRGNINYSSIVSSKTALRDTRGAIFAFPQVSITNTMGVGNGIKFYLRGFSHYLTWENFTSASATTRTASASVSTNFVTSASAYPDNAPFIYDVSSSLRTSKISTNNTFFIADESSNGQTYWEYLQQIAESGDGSQRWVAGITPTDYHTKTRYIYYRAARLNIDYALKGLTEPGIIRAYVGGRVIAPQWIRPDRSVMVTDILPAFLGDDPDNDPRTFYIETVSYDAETQTVTLSGGDNTTLEGAYRYNRYYQKVGVPFGGAPLQRT